MTWHGEEGEVGNDLNRGRKSSTLARLLPIEGLISIFFLLFSSLHQEAVQSVVNSISHLFCFVSWLDTKHGGFTSFDFGFLLFHSCAITNAY